MIDIGTVESYYRSQNLIPKLINAGFEIKF